MDMTIHCNFFDLGKRSLRRRWSTWKHREMIDWKPSIFDTQVSHKYKNLVSEFLMISTDLRPSRPSRSSTSQDASNGTYSKMSWLLHWPNFEICYLESTSLLGGHEASYRVTDASSCNNSLGLGQLTNLTLLTCPWTAAALHLCPQAGRAPHRACRRGVLFPQKKHGTKTFKASTIFWQNFA